MRSCVSALGAVSILFLASCAHIDFGGEGLTYYDPKPYLFVATTKECMTTATVLAIPAEKKTMTFKSGYGSSELGATLANGMIVSANQKSDAKVSETLGSLAALVTAVPGLKPLEAGKTMVCKPKATLYPVEAGKPDFNAPVAFPVETEVIDTPPKRWSK